jgi:hypothetical protein
MLATLAPAARKWEKKKKKHYMENHVLKEKGTNTIHLG